MGNCGIEKKGKRIPPEVVRRISLLERRIKESPLSFPGKTLGKQAFEAGTIKMGRAREVHWHGLRSFQPVIRQVPDPPSRTPQSSFPPRCCDTTTLPLPSHRDTPQDTRTVLLLPILSPIYRCGKWKEPCFSTLSSQVARVHNNRISSKSDRTGIVGESCKHRSIPRWIIVTILFRNN